MDFLDRILGVHVAYKNEDIPPMPNYIYSRYTIRKASLDEIKVAFIYPIGELDSINEVKKHVNRIKEIMELPVVLILKHITYRQGEYLIKDRIPFIVEGKQIYLPFMAAYLQERCDGERTRHATLLPSAQLLLLYYIYQGCGNVSTSDAAKALSFTPTSISRASRELEELGLITTEKVGVQKLIHSENTPKNLFEEAQKYLVNPVKRTIYVPKDQIKKDLLKSGYSALSYYSMLNQPLVESFASGNISSWNHSVPVKLYNSDEEYAVELWRYDPKRLSHGQCVDRLSLVLSLREDKDERVEEAVEELLAQVWRDIDGKRN